MSTQIIPRTLPTPFVGTASVNIAPKNPTRAALFVFNPGAQTIYLCADDTVATVAGAGTFALISLTGMQLDGWTAGINAIAQSGGSNPITVQEY